MIPGTLPMPNFRDTLLFPSKVYSPSIVAPWWVHPPPIAGEIALPSLTTTLPVVGPKYRCYNFYHTFEPLLVNLSHLKRDNVKDKYAVPRIIPIPPLFGIYSFSCLPFSTINLSKSNHPIL